MRITKRFLSLFKKNETSQCGNYFARKARAGSNVICLNDLDVCNIMFIVLPNNIFIIFK